MKSVLISIQPKWCELIALGKKTVEVRKSKPKIETPFKCYIYATKPKRYYKVSDHLAATDENLYLSNGKVKMCDGFEFWADDTECEYLSGKVIGEFVCDEIAEYESEFWDDETYENLKRVIHTQDWDGYPELDYTIFAENGEENSLCKSSCLTWEELRNYIGQGINTFYAWHITDLVIYDKPRKLSEFYAEGDCDCLDCKKCAWFDKGNGYNLEDDCKLAYKGAELHKSFKPIKRPPQSWMYVEEI